MDTALSPLAGAPPPCAAAGAVFDRSKGRKANAVDIDAAVVWHRAMAIVLERPGIDTLGDVLTAHRK